MSIDRRTCYVLCCDACRTQYGETSEEGYIVHFDTADTALNDAVECGWRIDEQGHLYCDRCIALTICVTEGHDYGPWIPCRCHGWIPEHAQWGCGLFRSCRRCGECTDTDLAHLPTTDEPQSFGR